MPHTTSLAARLLALTQTKDDGARKKALEAEHPLLKSRREAIVLLADAYEGDGGFLDGGYLWRFPAEILADFTERQEQARYHNFFEALVDIYVRHLYGQNVTRSTGSQDLEAWWDDVDGAGTTMAEFVKTACAHALVQGHTGALVDKTPDLPTGPAKADERARVIATLYPADTVLDWRLHGNELVAVKLSEGAPDPDITEEASTTRQFLVWDRQEWARFDAEGEFISDAVHNLGLVPIAMLRPKPSKRHAFIGRPLVNANVVRALYNRASEEDHVLRNQGFSLLGVQVPADATAEAIEFTQKQVEANYGVKRAIVSVGSLGYASPDMQIPAAIRENMQFLIRELYRAAHISFERDSLEAESAESLRIKHVELNEMLRNLAQAMSEFERRIARFWFGWNSPTADAAQKAFDAANVTAQYPTEFFLKDLEADIRAWAEAIRLGLPDVFVKRIKKRVVNRIEPEMPPDVRKEVEDAIDAMPEKDPNEPTLPGGLSADELRERARQRVTRMTGQPPEAEDEAA